MTGIEQGIANWKDLHRVAGEMGLTFFLMDGTLLGAIRDGGFCKNDWDDIDIGIFSAEYDRTAEMVRRLKPLGFEVFKETVYKSTVCRKGRLEGFGIRRGGCHFDVMRICRHPIRAECYNIGSGPSGYMAFVYPAFRELEDVEFYGLQCKKPVNHEEYLTARYSDWRTPRTRPGWNWLTMSNMNSIQMRGGPYDDILIPT